MRRNFKLLELELKAEDEKKVQEQEYKEFIDKVLSELSTGEDADEF